jgi:hypothetical protein
MTPNANKAIENVGLGWRHRLILYGLGAFLWFCFKISYIFRGPAYAPALDRL